MVGCMHLFGECLAEVEESKVEVKKQKKSLYTARMQNAIFGLSSGYIPICQNPYWYTFKENPIQYVFHMEMFYKCSKMGKAKNMTEIRSFRRLSGFWR